MKAGTLIDIFAALLILLYVYTAVSKLLSFNDFEIQMRMQVLPAWLISLLVWTLPSAELLLAVLLLLPNSRNLGLWLSAFVLLAFTIYIGAAYFHWMDRVPCACGGVIRSLGWRTHLWFNLFFLLLNIYAIKLVSRERRIVSS